MAVTTVSKIGPAHYCLSIRHSDRSLITIQHHVWVVRVRNSDALRCVLTHRLLTWHLNVAGDSGGVDPQRRALALLQALQTWGWPARPSRWP